MTLKVSDAANRKVYTKPELVVYGSVRNLTGGSFAAQNDVGQGAGGSNPNSDRRMKENIVQVDIHPAGFGLYLFDYKPEFHGKCAEGRQFGVMADEIALSMPDAVSTDEDGYATVNYGMLGITQH